MGSNSLIKNIAKILGISNGLDLGYFQNQLAYLYSTYKNLQTRILESNPKVDLSISLLISNLNTIFLILFEI